MHLGPLKHRAQKVKQPSSITNLSPIRLNKKNRDFSYLNELDSDSLLKMAVLLFELYASVDLSANILAEYDNRKNTQLQDIFLDTISKKGVNTSFISVKDWSD